MGVMENLEDIERLTLIKEATLSSNSKGRKIKEKKDEIRTCFMIDRDRILHSKAFRRLKHKTQVFIRSYGDHYRTRLTHTLEVSQIGRTISKGLRLNEDLVEAIALGHDIGHVAFAHIGEEVLNDILPSGFKHNIQSIRVISKLEKDGKGLNLTYEVIDGIANHSGFNNSKAKDPFTLEGQVVKYSDKIAYINHDIDDSIRAKILSIDEIPKDIIKVLGKTHGERIDTLVRDIIKNTYNNLNSKKVKVQLSREVNDALKELREFMFKNIYRGEQLKEEREKAKFILFHVYEYFKKYPEKMPKMYIEILEKEGLQRAVVDYIAGMSDDYCIHCFNKIYIPKFVIY